MTSWGRSGTRAAGGWQAPGHRSVESAVWTRCWREVKVGAPRLQGPYPTGGPGVPETLKYRAARGMRDVLPDEVGVWERLERARPGELARLSGLP